MEALALSTFLAAVAAAVIAGSATRPRPAPVPLPVRVAERAATRIKSGGFPQCRRVRLDRSEFDTLIEPSEGPSERRPSDSRLDVTDHGRWSPAKPRDRHKGTSSTTPPAMPEAAVVKPDRRYTNALLMGRAFAHAHRVPASALTEGAEELCTLAAGDRLAIVLAQARFREFVAVDVPNQADERALRLLDAARRRSDAPQAA